MMHTRCPSCKTAFRVTPEQLKTRAGKVRCGHCRAVFNALESLEETIPPTAEELAAPPSPPPGAPPQLPATESGDPSVVSAPETIFAAPELPPQAPIPAGSDGAPRGHRLKGLLWATALLVLTLLTSVHAAYVYRTDLLASEPALRPWLATLCEMLDCDLPLPRQANRLSIEASDLHPDAKQGKLFVLTATLKNRAPFAQAYPMLELTLTDTRDQPLARKVLGPADYLAPEHEVNAGFAANADLAIAVWIDAAEVSASGYRLYLFYP